MKPRTGAVRALLVVLFGGVLLAAAALWLISYESAAMFPEYAQLRLPVYLIAVAGRCRSLSLSSPCGGCWMLSTRAKRSPGRA